MTLAHNYRAELEVHDPQYGYEYWICLRGLRTFRRGAVIFGPAPHTRLNCDLPRNWAFLRWENRP